MPPQTFGKYVVTQLLGRGGMAEVYRARHPTLDRFVAIKAIHRHLATEPGFRDRFRREASLVASLRHPHIVQLHDFDVVDDQPFMVMEYLGGGTLKERLAQSKTRGETMPTAEITHLLKPIADALDYAHTRSAVHRDIKPANILFTLQGEPVLSDFGIAKILSESTQVTVSGSIVGTPAYMSPEQAASREIDARSDLYSLGIVLYEMLAGRVPFKGDSPTTVMMQHLNTPPPPPRQFNPNIPEPIQAVVLRALAKDPARRFATAGDLAQAFCAASRGEQPQVTPNAETLQKPAWETTIVPPSPAPPSPHLTTRALPRLLKPIVPALLALLLGAGQLFGFDTDLPVSLAKYLPLLIGLLFVTSVVACLIGVVRAGSGPRRAQTAVFLALTAVAGLLWVGWFFTSRPPLPGGLVIVVGEFDGSHATRQVDFARRISEQLENELRDVGGAVRVVRTDETYPDAETARARSARHQATLVIWGWYDDAGVSPHVEVLQVPSREWEIVSVPFLLEPASAAAPDAFAAPRQPGLRNVARFVRAPATLPDLNLFVKDGPQQMTYIAAAILGVAFYADGDPALALALFDKALANAPAGGGDIVGQEVVYFHRATILHEQNQVADAVADLQQALDLEPDLYEAHHNLAIAYSEMCTPTLQLDRAIEEAQTAARLKPTDASARLLLGDLYRQAGEHNKAIAEFQSAIELDATDVRTYQALAQSQMAVGQADAAYATRQNALKLLDKAVTGQTLDMVRAHLALAEAHMSVGDYDKAIVEYQGAQNVAPDDPRVHRGLGDAYYWKGDLVASERAYREMVRLSPNDATAHFLLGLLYTEEGSFASAVEELQQAATLSPCFVDSHLVLANLYYEHNDYAKAAAEYAAAAAIDPQNADLFYVLGVTQFLQDQLDGAKDSLERATVLHVDFVEAHFALSSVYYEQKDYQGAANERELVVELAPNEPFYYQSLAFAYEKLQQLANAVVAYQKSLALKDDADTRLYLGLVLFEQQKYSAAIAEYQKSLALDPQNYWAYAALGDAYLQQGKWDEAVTAFQNALVWNEDVYVRTQLANVYLLQGEIDAAVTEFQKAIALEPTAWRTHLQLGDLFRDTGKLDDAVEQYRAVLTIEPDNTEAHLRIATIEYKRCNVSVAVQQAHSAAANHPDETWYRAVLAALYEAQGRDDDAAQMYADLREAPASELFAHLAAGEYLYRVGDFSEAVSEYQSILEVADLPASFASAAHFGLGQVYYQEDKLIPAEREFILSLSAFSHNASAQARLGDVALRNDDAESALEAYAQAMDLLPAYAQQVSADEAAVLAVNLHAKRGLALARQNDPDDSIAAFEQAVALAQALVDQAPQWPLARFALGYAYTASGDEASAEPEFAAAIQCDQSLATMLVHMEAELKKLRAK